MSQFSVVFCGNVYTAAQQLPFVLHMRVRLGYTGRLMMRPSLRKLMPLSSAVVTCLRFVKVKFSFVASPLRLAVNQGRCPDLGAHVDTK